VTVTVEHYVHFQEQGFLIVPGVLAPGEVWELHVDGLLAGRVELAGAAAFGEDNKKPGGRDAPSLPVAIPRKRIPTAGGRWRW
jgi:hypothetical protein